MGPQTLGAQGFAGFGRFGAIFRGENESGFGPNGFKSLQSGVISIKNITKLPQHLVELMNKKINLSMFYTTRYRICIAITGVFLILITHSFLQ